MLRTQAKKCLVVASLVAAMLFAPSVGICTGKTTAATAKESESARDEIQAIYNRLAADYARKDLKSAQAYRTENYVHIDKNGLRTPRNDEDDKQEAAALEALESFSVWVIIQEFKLKGNTATALIRVGVTLVEPASKDRERSVFKGTIRALDTWVKRDGKWLCSQRKTLASYATVNGKVEPQE